MQTVQHGVFTQRIETLTNDFFVNLLDMSTTWKATEEADDAFEGRDRLTGELKWTGTRVDLIFGANSQLLTVAKIYGSEDSQDKFVHDFVSVWRKVMNLDRFDLAYLRSPEKNKSTSFVLWDRHLRSIHRHRSRYAPVGAPWYEPTASALWWNYFFFRDPKPAACEYGSS